MLSLRRSACSEAEIDPDWLKQNHAHIERHPAWRGEIQEGEAESLLKSRKPFSYLLRYEPENCLYFITFVQPDLSIKHQYFTLEFSRKGWYYRNGEVQGPKEVVAQSISELIPFMMHCNPEDCQFLQRILKI